MRSKSMVLVVASAVAVAVIAPTTRPEADLSAALAGSSPIPSPAEFGPAAALPGGDKRSSVFGSALTTATPVRPGPSTVVVHEATDTIYVANGDNANGSNAGGNTVSVIDGCRCRSTIVSGCQGQPAVGNLPSSIAVDQTTDTV